MFFLNIIEAPLNRYWAENLVY